MLENSGILLANKPQGVTSHDVVSWARRAFATRRIGHAGTLDPMATGVLVVAVNEATKLVPYLTHHDKVYTGKITLGVATNTWDAEGSEVERAPVPVLEPHHLGAIEAKFRGDVLQAVPAFSAVKIEGRTLYDWARRGEEKTVPSRVVHIFDLTLVIENANTLSFRCHVSKGTYVRSLAVDISQALGTVGHLSELCRVQSGEFALDDAIDARVLRAPENDWPRIEKSFRSIKEACKSWNQVRLSEEGERDALCGRPVLLTKAHDIVERDVVEKDIVAGTSVLLLGRDERPIAIAERQEFSYRILRGLNLSET